MKKWQKIIFVMFILIFLTGASTVWYFRNELQAVMYYVEYSQEELDELKTSNDQLLVDVLERTQVMPKTENAQTPAIDEKAIDADEKIDINEPGPEEEEGEHIQMQAEDAALTEMVDEVYTLRSSFENELDDLLEQMKEEYLALPKEQRAKQKITLAAKYMKKAAAMEEACDSKMEEILIRMKQHLEETGGDVSLADDVRTIYENEKALKKSHYMSYL